jgi:ABC-type molybdate transport system substrate-binding protein
MQHFNMPDNVPATPSAPIKSPPHLVECDGRRSTGGLRLLVLILAAGIAMTPIPVVAETVLLYSAGSLNPALTDVSKAYQAASGNAVQATFGPSGLLKDKIAGGAAAHVFASANMDHPQALAVVKKSGPVSMFARNKLCALVRPGLNAAPENLLDRMLDSQIKVGISTPKADPSGDYAFEVFAKADALRPGARAALEAKALQLMGGPQSATPPAGRLVYGWHIAEGRADIFLAYCTGAIAAQQQNPGQQVVALPDDISVGADYGLTVMTGAPAAAQQFAQFILSPQGRNIIVGYGFAPPTP